jgi:hypothetical protein
MTFLLLFSVFACWGVLAHPQVPPAWAVEGGRYWCVAEPPSGPGSLCSEHYDAESLNYQKCHAELTCTDSVCSLVSPGLQCRVDADCGARDTGCSDGVCGLKIGLGAPVVSMQCLGGVCGYPGYEGEPCNSPAGCASGICEDLRRCQGIPEGRPCNATAPGNPCGRGLFCSSNFTAGAMGRCEMTSPRGGRCQRPPADSSLENSLDSCVAGSVCVFPNSTDSEGTCETLMGRGEGQSCDSVVPALMCNGTLVCLDGRCSPGLESASGPMCNATTPCPANSYCSCPADLSPGASGLCVAASASEGCHQLFLAHVQCLERQGAPSHELLGSAPIQIGSAAYPCGDTYTAWHCCLSDETQAYWTSAVCPTNYLRIGVSVTIMIGGAVTGVVLGLAVGCWWARRHSALNKRFIRLAASLKREQAQRPTAKQPLIH